MKFSIKYKIIF